MKFDLLTEREKKVVYECVNAVAIGPFIPEVLFPTLMGFEKNEYIRFVTSWKCNRIKNKKEADFIYCALHQLLEYPHGQDDVWPDFISEPKHKVSEISYKFSGANRPLEKRWNGIIQGYLTPKAKKRWDRFGEKSQKLILTSVWCPHCSKKTTITNYEGGIDNSNRISIYGKCVTCFKNIEKTI